MRESMILYSVGVRGGLKKIGKADFQENEVYLIDDSKTMYLWFGSNITQKRREVSQNKANLINDRKENAANIQIINQNKEYGAFLAIKEDLMKGEIKKQNLERRPELEIRFDTKIGVKCDICGKQIQKSVLEIALENSEQLERGIKISSGFGASSIEIYPVHECVEGIREIPVILDNNLEYRRYEKSRPI